MTRERYIIERRNPDGSLDLKGPQPESVFGLGAIEGMDDWAMSRVIFRHVPDATLTGDSISLWPAQIDPAWVARLKTW
jgi:hypothetical protein